MKSYAPRFTTGRVEADACCLLKDRSALLIVQQQVFRDSTGAENSRKSLFVADLASVVGLEFASLEPLKLLGVPMPLLPDAHEYRPGTLVG